MNELSRVALFAIVLGGGALAPTAASAQPQGERIGSAAEEFDAGRRAFLANDFERAAVHFENAFHDAPRPEPLRHAIRSRSKAGQNARAATLGEVARKRYPEDEGLAQLAKETLDAAAPRLHAVVVRCEPQCSVAIDGRVSSLVEEVETRFYVEPGDHEVLVTWSEDRAQRVAVHGKAAGSDAFELKAPPIAPKPGPEGPKEKAKPLGRVPFFVGAGVTVLAGAFTAWSYVDAKNSPGEDAVRRECVNLGESCPTWKDAKSVELRTNILIGATVGVGLATAVIGTFFTRWSASPTKGALAPTVATDGRGAILGLGGTL